jgi:hypothetical protein
MEISGVDLGVCRGYAYEGDPRRTAIVLPGAMLGGMPVNAFAIYALVARGWSAVQVWDEFLDRSLDATEWTRVRAEAALRHAGDPPGALVVAKSLTTRAAGLAAERSLPAVWLTPLLADAATVELLRARTAPALLVGGTADPMWDGALARELSDDVLELPDADHGFAQPDGAPRGILDNLRTIVDRLDDFAVRLE